MRFDFYRGGLVATLAAGPIFLAMAGLSAIVLDPAAANRLFFTSQELAMLLPIFAASIVLGAILAVLPVWIGGSAMGWAAARNIGLTHPAIWALTGGALAAGVALPLDPALASPLTLALIATAAICATIVRYGTRWSD